MSMNVLASAALVVNVGVAPTSTGSDANGLPSSDWTAELVMYLTNASAWVLFLVLAKIERLMPATWLATWVTALAGAGKATTPYASFFIPLDAIVAPALFWLRIIAALPLVKSGTALVPLSYCALDGLTTLSVCM